MLFRSMMKRKDYLAVITIILLSIIAIAGILSMNFSYAHDYVNQYGQQVQLFGYGIYARDTYFKAPISIGTDFCILFVLVPVFLYTYNKYQNQKNEITELQLISVYAVSTYYGASIAFGVVYNQFFLLYVLLFSCSLFGMFMHLTKLGIVKCVEATAGKKWFLVLSGIALIVAWLPDIVPTLFSGETLPLIGVYTTEITYVLDMGIISPVCFLTFYLMKRKNPLATVLFAILSKLCIIVGVMMIPQAICQVLSGIDIAFPILATKSLSFLLLCCFSFYFNRNLYQEIS